MMLSKPFKTISYGVLALILLFFPIFSSSEYFIHILIMCLMFAYLGNCWNILAGFTGQYSLGHALFVGAGAYTSALLFISYGVSPWLGMWIGALIATFLGLFMGFVSFRYDIRGPFFFLLTLAFAQIFFFVTINIRSLGGASGLMVPLKGKSALMFQFVSKAPYYYIMLLMTFASLAICYFIRRGKLGHYLFAIKGNEAGAKALGIDVFRYKLIATGISSGMSALAGSFYAQYVLFIDPESILGIGLSLDIMIYPLIGGIGTVMGPTVGAFLLLPITEFIRALLGGGSAGLHRMAYGLILIIVIIIIPGGLLSVFSSVTKWFGRGQSRR